MGNLKINVEAFRLYYGYDLELNEEEFQKEFARRYTLGKNYDPLEGILIAEGFPLRVSAEVVEYEISQREKSLLQLGQRCGCPIDDLKFLIGRLLDQYELKWVTSGSAQEKTDRHSPRLKEILASLSKRQLSQEKRSKIACREEELRAQHNL